MTIFFVILNIVNILIFHYYFTDLILRNNKKKRQLKCDLNKIKEISSIEKENCDSQNISDYIAPELKNTLYKYRKKVIDVKKNINLSYMNRNLQDLIIRISNREKIDGIAIGSYYPKTNEIYLTKNKENDALSHEFLHMCSSLRNKEKTISGFLIADEKFEIGSSINEGYTSFLDNKLFKMPLTYYFESRIAFIIEQIIGEEKMMKSYFESNLYYLVEELSKYYNKEKIIDIFKNMDAITKYKYFNKSKKQKYKKCIIFCAKKVNKYIDEIMINYLKKLNDIEIIKFLENIKRLDNLNCIDESLPDCSNKNTADILNTIYNKSYKKATEHEKTIKKLLLKYDDITKKKEN